MKTFFEELTCGQKKTVTLNGTYLKAFARAVEGRQPFATAELLLLTDDSGEDTEVQLYYAENESIREYVFFQMNTYTNNNENLIDILPFNYVRDKINRTGVIIVEKVATK